MDNKLNQKINQDTEKTLVIWNGHCRNTHYACFVDERGGVLQKSFAVCQSNDGFQRLYQRILKAMKQFRQNGTRCT